MSKTKEVFLAWKVIYSNWKYLLSALVIAIIFYLINVAIQNQNYNTIAAFYSSSGLLATISLFIGLAIGLKETMYPSSFTTLIITGLLLGMLLTLVVYKTVALKRHDTSKKQGVVATIGVFLGIAAPGCAACGVGLLALFGISASILASLPLMGLEISIIAIAILVFSVIYISKGLLECKTCKIQLSQDINAVNR